MRIKSIRRSSFLIVFLIRRLPLLVLVLMMIRCLFYLVLVDFLSAKLRLRLIRVPLGWYLKALICLFILEPLLGWMFASGNHSLRLHLKIKLSKFGTTNREQYKLQKAKHKQHPAYHSTHQVSTWP